MLLSSSEVFASGKGWADQYSAWSYAGWACDPSVPGYQTPVHIWRDDGKFLGGTMAVNPREAAVGAACSSTHSAHGFSINIEQKTELMDGRVHAVTLYVIDQAGQPYPFSTVSVAFPYSSDNVAAPKSPGDVVGRDLNVAGLGALGHIGIWDGASVIEMLNEGSGNKVFMNSWENFKSRSIPWNTAYPNYSGHSVKSCWGTTCDIHSNRPDQQTYTAQQATFRRAYQIYLIGANYTITTSTTAAEPEMRDYTDGWRRPAQRGTYRCDTFIIQAFRGTTEFDNVAIFPWRDAPSAPETWRQKVSSLSSILSFITPSNVIDKIRAF